MFHVERRGLRASAFFTAVIRLAGSKRRLTKEKAVLFYGGTTGDLVMQAWHERMARARRWHYTRLTAHSRRQPDYTRLREVAAQVIAKRGDGSKLAPEPTRVEILEAYKRVIRRNLNWRFYREDGAD